jgi:hypothetical protein
VPVCVRGTYGPIASSAGGRTVGTGHTGQHKELHMNELHMNELHMNKAGYE